MSELISRIFSTLLLATGLVLLPMTGGQEPKPQPLAAERPVLEIEGVFSYHSMAVIEASWLEDQKRRVEEQRQREQEEMPEGGM